MGWNSKTFEPITYILNWRDRVSDDWMDSFEAELTKEVQAFIAQKIKAKFATEIANDDINFMIGEYDSYTKN